MSQTAARGQQPPTVGALLVWGWAPFRVTPVLKFPSRLGLARPEGLTSEGARVNTSRTRRPGSGPPHPVLDFQHGR